MFGQTQLNHVHGDPLTSQGCVGTQYVGGIQSGGVGGWAGSFWICVDDLISCDYGDGRANISSVFGVDPPTKRIFPGL